MTRWPASPMLLPASMASTAGVGLVGRRRHHHALAGGEAIGLHHDGRTLRIDVGMGFGGDGEGAEGRRNAVACHELLGKILELVRAAAWAGAENAQACCAEGVDHAGCQRGLGADHREGDVGIAPHELHQCRNRRERLTSPSSVAVPPFRRDENLGNLGRREFPREGVFATAGADDEDFHGFLLKGGLDNR